MFIFFKRNDNCIFLGIIPSFKLMVFSVGWDTTLYGLKICNANCIGEFICIGLYFDQISEALCFICSSMTSLPMANQLFSALFAKDSAFENVRIVLSALSAPLFPFLPDCLLGFPQCRNFIKQFPTDDCRMAVRHHPPAFPYSITSLITDSTADVSKCCVLLS